MHIAAELCVVCLKVLWSFAAAAARWLVKPQEKRVHGRVCVITGAGSGLGRLFALHFARRGAALALWDINRTANEETAELVREIYRQNNTDSSARTGESPRSPEHREGGAPFSKRTSHRTIIIIIIIIHSLFRIQQIKHLTF